jgi:carboxyl-terminal processing protease
MRSGLRRVWVFILILSGLALSTGCHVLDPRPPETISGDPKLDSTLLTEAWNTIEKYYVEKSAVKPKEMTYGAIRGMVEALGDKEHSRFLTPEMAKQERNLTKGELEGIGAELRMKENRPVIVAPLDDSPAQRAGVKAGDIILKVNGEEVDGLSLEEVVRRILGPPGTSVGLTVRHAKGEETADLTIVRARITIRSVTWHRLPGAAIVHLRIAAFSRNTGADLREALRAMQADMPAGVILDLRNNPGGLLDQAVAAASEFLAGGDVVLEKNAAGKIKRLEAKPGGLATAVPLAVIINVGTASGAEIVAGALQDAHRAMLVGEKTFGTGTVLREFTLSDGSALLLAIEEWLTPAGHVIWHKGIVPDIAVSLRSDVTPLTPAQEKEMTPEELRASGDDQLLRAFELLLQDKKPRARGTMLPARALFARLHARAGVRRSAP